MTFKAMGEFLKISVVCTCVWAGTTGYVLLISFWHISFLESFVCVLKFRLLDSA